MKLKWKVPELPHLPPIRAACFLPGVGQSRCWEGEGEYPESVTSTSFPAAVTCPAAPELGVLSRFQLSCEDGELKGELPGAPCLFWSTQ
jgi:hypothetical protein